MGPLLANGIVHDRQRIIGRVVDFAGVKAIEVALVYETPPIIVFISVLIDAMRRVNNLFVPGDVRLRVQVFMFGPQYMAKLMNGIGGEDY